VTLAPALSTERLMLRPMTAGDFAVYEAFLASERPVFTGGPFARTDAGGMCCHGVALRAPCGQGAPMPERRVGGSFAQARRNPRSGGRDGSGTDPVRVFRHHPQGAAL
jgi:hypothetical protein